ncbi:MAG: FAD-binding protein [Deltaproteobacteria bacterium]|nr:FAD-binding protein [Deltaproteobacteria bacterium]MCB9785231.1 FAD-binding protein [Deltaproteobacteria bacterium]
MDVVVVGAGTAGAAAAAACAERGLGVRVLERRPLEEAGARWVNGVPGWCFDRAGLARPVGDELRGSGEAATLVAGMGPHRVRIEGHDVLEVDMRALTARLQELARQRGARLEGGVTVQGLDGDTLRTSAGPVRTRYVVDASGLGGAGLIAAPRPAPDDLCTAAQEVRRVSDPALARDFFARHGVPFGEAVVFSSLDGGFSIINVRSDGEHVSILTGSIPALGHASGRAILDRFVASAPWVGERVFGGSRAIPLGRPADILARGRVALLGDAALQVFSAHGSGIGAGLIAAADLARALADGSGPEAYGVRWMREWGGLFASYDVFRRYSQRRSLADIETLMRAGLMPPELARAALDQQPVRPGPSALAALARGSARAPRAAAKMLPVVARMQAVRAWYGRYPSDAAAVPRWSRRAAWLAGENPGAAAREPVARPADPVSPRPAR